MQVLFLLELQLVCCFFALIIVVCKSMEKFVVCSPF